VALIAIVLVLIVLIGATYQGVTTAIERRRFPFPGRLVDVGGHQLHLYCTGTGAPTVVLEAPAAGMSAAWGWVQGSISQLTRVCSYERAGLGWSEAASRSFDPAAVPRELHALLMGSAEPGPYVVAGQGLGALFARWYAAEHPGSVAALILIDQPKPETAAARSELGRLLSVSPWLARTGILRATTILSSVAEGLPASSAGALIAFLNRPDHLARAAGEVNAWEAIALGARSTALPTALPITEVDTSDRSGLAFLASSADAERVNTAIRTAVRTFRAAAASRTAS
jgi:pimeloyl-ACP methyl ester carboxylesterase